MSDVSRFTVRLIAFVLAALLVIGAYFYLFKSNIPMYERIGAGVYNSIKKSKQANANTKRLVLGDSVCAQMYPNKVYSDTINSLACNHAVTLVGYHSLLKNFLDNFEGNKDSLEVYFVYRPSSFRNNLDQRYTFNYFLKPFNTSEYINNFSPTVNDAIEEIPFSWLSKFDFIKKSDWAPKFRTIHKIHDFKMAPIAAEYLLRMETLCQLHDVQFKVMPTFMSNEFEEYDFTEFNDQLKAFEVDHLFGDYFDNIEWIESIHFGDGAHLKKKYVDEKIHYNYYDL